LSALLLWRLLWRLGIHHAWVGGLLFVVHPVCVSSVAWLAELKNVLSLPLLLGAMLAWLRYDATQQAKHYAASLGLFLASLLAKTAGVMFPVVLLLYAWWRRGRVSWPGLRRFGSSLSCWGW
jgi:hypothetical protein